MNERPLPNESRPHESTGLELTEPHFDDIAIAIAQPVEPLALAHTSLSGWQKFSALRGRVSTRMLLVVLAVAVGFGTVALGLAGVHRQLNSEAAPATVVAEQPRPAETVEAAKTEKDKPTSPRPASRRTQPRATTDGKPVARKVGELTN